MEQVKNKLTKKNNQTATTKKRSIYNLPCFLLEMLWLLKNKLLICPEKF